MALNPFFSLYEKEYFHNLQWKGIDGEPSTYAIRIDIIDGKAEVSESRLCGESSISQWILEAQFENSKSEGGLRLILAANPEKAHFRKAAGHEHFHDNDDFLGFWFTGACCMGIKRRLYSLSAIYNIFSQSHRLQHRQATQGGLNMDLGLGLSFDHERNTTFGMLLGCSNLQAAFIVAQLNELAHLACHPLLLPTMILGYERSFLGTELHRTRATSGQTMWPIIDYAGQPGRFELQPNNVDTKQLSKDALGVVQSATVYQRLMEDLLILTNSVAESNDVLRRSIQGKGQTFDSIEMIEVRLKFLRNNTELMLPALRSYKDRAHAQISAVYNLIAEQNNEINRQLGTDTQEIAAASKRDSSARKSIAVLTMVFLPGTFLATVFAMPFFDFSATQGQPMVLPHFWIYWAFVIPLTVTVIFLCLIVSHVRQGLGKIREWDSKIYSRL